MAGPVVVVDAFDQEVGVTGDEGQVEGGHVEGGGLCEWVSGGGSSFGGGEGEGGGEQCEGEEWGRGRAEVSGKEDWGEERKGRWKGLAICTKAAFERTDAGGHVPCEIEGER